MMTVLSLLPIVSLLICLVLIKLPVTKSGAISLGIALLIALVFYGFSFFGLSVAVGKALSLALFVSLIVWCALFLYHLVDDFKAIEVINKNIVVFVGDKFVQFLILSWLFTAFLQGIAGFGVPIVIITPILISLGFDKIKALSAALIGHSWAVTFGSMGSAFFTIQMITGIEPNELGFPAWIFNTSAHLLTGIGVCWIYDGLKGIKKGISYVLPVSAVMAFVQFFVIYFEMYALATLVTALTGLAAMYGLYRLRIKTSGKPVLYAGKLTLLQAVLPYAVILVLLLSFQFIPAEVRNNISVAFKFPETVTSLGYEVQAEAGFSRIRLFGHPAVVLLIAAVVAVVTYKRAGVWDKSVYKGAVKKTLKKGIPATLALLALGNMSLIMMDSGMMLQLAKTVADLTGGLYPLFSPFIGSLASFLTGNNTNSNVMFGAFQQTIAQRLEVSQAVMSAAQTISGSVGVSISPTLVLMGALSSKQQGSESLIYKKVLPVIIVIALIMGIINYVVINYLILQ
ncbi:MAG: L-lactate permease [Oscillospiraceae bacterium]|nr:L-lactate permease [Oscillospiraceae bacterium]